MRPVSSPPPPPAESTVRVSQPPPGAVLPGHPLPPGSSPAIDIPKAYESEPPVIRDRMPTLELADDDLVVEEPIARRRSTPPPPPPVRSTIVPRVEGLVMPRIAPMPVPHIDTPVAALAPVVAPVTEFAPVSRIQPVQQRPTSAPVMSFEPVKTVEAVKPKLESMLDPSEALFDGMYELNYADSHWEAARLCATALGRALGARTVIIHAHDLVTHELRAIGVHGDGEFDLLGTADGSDDDLVASAVICNEKAVKMRVDGALPRLAPKRLGMIKAPQTLVAIPVLAWGRCVALIEIIDADERLATRVADSAAYVAERLAEFLSARAAA